MSFGDRMRPWEPGGEVLEVLFGHGGVSVGGLRLGASVSLCLGELDEPQEVGACVQQIHHDAERVRLTFTKVASIDVVLKHLRALRWHLSHQCDECGEPLECSARRCAACRNLRAHRLAETGSEAEMMNTFMDQHWRFQEWLAAERLSERLSERAAEAPCEP